VLGSRLFLTIFYEKNTPATTFPLFPLGTLFFNAGYQGRIKIRVHEIGKYRIFLAELQRNHGAVLSVYPHNFMVGRVKIYKNKIEDPMKGVFHSFLA
jgi:hypothetical protein